MLNVIDYWFLNKCLTIESVIKWFQECHIESDFKLSFYNFFKLSSYVLFELFLL